MTELGKEILHAMQHDEWQYNKFTLRHKKSGLELWIGNGPRSFNFHRIDKLKFDDDVCDNLLSPDDKFVLWHQAMCIVQKYDASPAAVVLNLLRLSQHQTGEIV